MQRSFSKHCDPADRRWVMSASNMARRFGPLSLILILLWCTMFILPGMAKDQNTVAAGAKIVDPQGREIATVNNADVDPRSGAIVYVVIEPGLRDRLIPVPRGAFQEDSKGRLVLDVDRGRILTAPNYPKGTKPDWGDPAWRNAIARFWSPNIAPTR